jgi:hypothetical protein
MDPAERLSGPEALQHAFFDGLRDENTIGSIIFQERIESANPKTQKF